MTNKDNQTLEVYKTAYLVKKEDGSIEIQDSHGRIFSIEADIISAKKEVDENKYYMIWLSDETLST